MKKEQQIEVREYDRSEGIQTIVKMYEVLTPYEQDNGRGEMVTMYRKEIQSSDDLQARKDACQLEMDKIDLIVSMIPKNEKGEKDDKIDQ